MSKFRALVFDIDGTAVENRRDAMPTGRLIRAITAARGRLELFAASGRSLRYGAPVLQALELTNPCIIGGGTIIIDPTTSVILDQSFLSLQTMAEIQRVMSRFPYHTHTGSTPTQTRPSTHGKPILKPQPYLLVLQVTPEFVTRIMQALSRIPGIIAATSPDFDGGHTIQVTNHNATKEHRIRQVLAQLGIDPEHTIGVGDGDNDIHLFAAVGHRVAMGNASDQLKSIADEIAPTVDHDGLAHIIEKYTN